MPAVPICYLYVQGITELLEDDDFQRDSDHGRLDRIVDDIKAQPQSYDKCALCTFVYAVSLIESAVTMVVEAL